MSRTLSVHQEHELLLALEKAGLSTDEAQAIINSKKNQLAKGMLGWLREQLAPPATRIGSDKFASYLLSLEDQLEALRQLDGVYWDANMSKAGWFDQLDITTEHVQTIDNLEILHVSFGSPEKDVEMWWKAIAGSQPNAWRWDGLKTDAKHLRLGPNTKQYEPGIHRVRINLLAHWEPGNGRSILRIREQAARSGETLAAAEVFAAYALHPDLLRRMGGDSLPYANLAGYEATVPGDQSWTLVPYLDWNGFDHRVILSADWHDYVCWAAPVLRES